MVAALTTGHQEKGSDFRVEPEVSQQVSEGTCQEGGLAIPVLPGHQAEQGGCELGWALLTDSKYRNWKPGKRVTLP